MATDDFLEVSAVSCEQDVLFRDWHNYSEETERKAELSVYQNKLMCLKPGQDMKLFGDWNTEAARVLLLVFEKCTGKPNCKSDQQIKDYLKDKYLILATRLTRFNTDSFGDESFSTYMKLNWHSIDVL